MDSKFNGRSTFHTYYDLPTIRSSIFEYLNGNIGGFSMEPDASILFGQTLAYIDKLEEGLNFAVRCVCPTFSSTICLRRPNHETFPKVAGRIEQSGAYWTRRLRVGGYEAETGEMLAVFEVDPPTRDLRNVA